MTIRGPEVSAQSSGARQLLGGDVPSWVTRPPADGKDYSFVGTATSASESQARGNAFDDAVRKAVVRVGTRLFQEPNAAACPGVDALRDYVRKVGRSASQYARPNPGGGYTAYALLQLNRGFAEPSAVRQYAAAPTAVQQQATTAIGYLLVPSDVGPSAVTRRTQVRMQNLRQGNFTLYFSIAGTKGQVWIRLDQIQVFDDGSAGTTRWTFDVFVDGRRAFSAPIETYSDDMVTYRMRAGDRSVEAQTTSAGGLIEIKVVGTRLSAASAKAPSW
jgi:hypothetical protein